MLALAAAALPENIIRKTFFFLASGLPFAAEDARTLHVSIPASAKTRSTAGEQYRTCKRSGLCTTIQEAWIA
jgi:hypothetical protein